MYTATVALVGLAVLLAYLLLTRTETQARRPKPPRPCYHSERSLGWPRAEWGHDGQRKVYRTCTECGRRVETPEWAELARVGKH